MNTEKESSEKRKEPKITFSPNKFAKAIDRILTDASLREKLENRPIETLEELGIEVDDGTRAKLAGKRLSQVIGPECALMIGPRVILSVITGGVTIYGVITKSKKD